MTREHAWLEAEPAALRRRFGIEEFEPLARSNGVGAAVLVQTLNDPGETRELLAIAATEAIVAGVVGWVDLEAPDAADLVAQVREAPGGAKLVGVRHLVQDEPDPAYLERPAVLRALAAVASSGLAVDLLVRPPQLAAALLASRRLEGARLVLDHGAKPPIGGDGLEEWALGVSALSRCENVVCKVSGLVTEAGPGWSIGQISPVIDRLLSWFGADRLLFGSDWPVSTAVASYDEVLEVAEATLGQLGEVEREAVLSGNARRAYGLPPLVR